MFLEVSRPTGIELVQLGQQRVTVGRAADNTIVLDGDPEVSRRHAVIEQLSGGWIVRGGFARNGTFMNGDWVDGEVRFRPGDVLRIGRTLITLHDEHDEHAEPLPVAVR